jgi:hypothetical protein
MRFWFAIRRGAWLLGALLLLAAIPSSAAEASTITDICPASGIQEWSADFQPDGIILTTFDRYNTWVYQIDDNRRYPLPDTFPCGTNCHLSRDSQWITYFNDSTNSYNKMRLDGTERTMLVEYAGDVDWWSPDTLLVWTPGHDAYLRAEDGTQREYLQVNGVLSVQPGGRWGLMVEPEGDGFKRVLVNLELRGLVNVREQRLELGLDLPYFDTAAWSPDGGWLAYVAPGAFDDEVGIAGGEIYGVRPGEAEPIQWTDLTNTYGAVRINGLSTGDLSWSPDGTLIAFWVTELLSADPTGNLGNAVIHILDTRTMTIQRYCGYSTTGHTPLTPRLQWSPDGTHLAFGGYLPDDDRGYLLLALDTASGVFTILSAGIYPALGTPDVIAWGLPR